MSSPPFPLPYNTTIANPDCAGLAIPAGAGKIDAGLLAEVLERLPLGITLRDDRDQILFVNEKAIRHVGADNIGRLGAEQASKRAGSTPGAELAF